MKNIAAKVLYHNLRWVKFPGGVTVAGFQFDSVIRPAKIVQHVLFKFDTIFPQFIGNKKQRLGKHSAIHLIRLKTLPQSMNRPGRNIVANHTGMFLDNIK